MIGSTSLFRDMYYCVAAAFPAPHERHDMDRYDAIVIGSGPNGLAAAITLAEHGRSVLVVEAAAHLGGAVATEELTLPGFRHDTFSSVYPAAAASPVFARMPLAQYGLRWIHPPVAMAHPFPDGRAAALYRDLNRTVDNLDRLTPGDGQAWRAFIAPYLARHDGDAADTARPFPAACWRLAAAHGPRYRRHTGVRAPRPPFRRGVRGGAFPGR